MQEAGPNAGGELWVESEVGKGSCFHFTIISEVVFEPEMGSDVASLSAGLTAATSVARLKILLAEDNLVNQKVATRLLEKQGHTVTSAGTGLAALSLFRSQPFDMILMDVQMPEMDGLEATAAIRRDEAVSGTHVPIIALTAHAMAGDRERCISAGMDGYASKPIRAEELKNEMQRLREAASGRVAGFPYKDNLSGTLSPLSLARRNHPSAR
jgi:CheY-like chemotaxis protein